jgi:hypothetical protein
VICLDAMGPEGAKSVPGLRLVPAAPAGARRRATQEIDDGRRGHGYVFGACVPATGAALTAPYPRRTTVTFVAFPEQVDAWLTPGSGRVYAVLDNLAAHRAPDALLWAPTHPRWEFVCQPKYAASLTLIEPWWNILRSLALKGRRFATGTAGCQAVEAATRYWNAHRHPFVWGTRKRRRPTRPTGSARLPVAA